MALLAGFWTVPADFGMLPGFTTAEKPSQAVSMD
jgi:hypothetical protein